MDELLQGKPFKDFSDDWYKGFDHGKVAGIQEGRREIIEEVKRLFDLDN